MKGLNPLVDGNRTDNDLLTIMWLIETRFRYRNTTNHFSQPVKYFLSYWSTSPTVNVIGTFYFCYDINKKCYCSYHKIDLQIRNLNNQFQYWQKASFNIPVKHPLKNYHYYLNYKIWDAFNSPINMFLVIFFL